MSPTETRDLHVPISAPPTRPVERPEESRAPKAAAVGGSVIQALGGLATVGLAIAGLAGAVPEYLAPIAIIVLGVAMAFGSAGSIAAHFTHLLSNRNQVEPSGEASPESVAGVAGIVLGILALLHVVPTILSPIAVIVFGASLLAGSGMRRVNYLQSYGTTTRPNWLAGETMPSGAGAHVLIGVAAIVLGIVSLVNFPHWILTLVALLCLGAGAVLCSAWRAGNVAQA